MSRLQKLDYSVDVLRVLLWQYNNANHLEGLLRLKQTFYNENQRDFWQSWINDVFNLNTCNLFGVSVWSKILDYPLTLEVNKSPGNYPAFSFSDDVGVSTSPIKNFSYGNFATPADEFENLTLDQNRLLLKLRYFNLITDASVSHINFILSIVFGSGVSYVQDNQDMTLTYVFKYLEATTRYFLVELDLLPRPSGVSYTIEVNDF
jgi:hypothetical protein